MSVDSGALSFVKRTRKSADDGTLAVMNVEGDVSHDEYVVVSEAGTRTINWYWQQLLDYCGVTKRDKISKVPTTPKS